MRIVSRMAATTMLLINLNTVYGASDKSLGRFRTYCRPVYRQSSGNDPIKKLIVVFRHGDRAPLKVRTDKWREAKCISCTKGSCGWSGCDDGNLTVKGFEQGRRLGHYIKSAYRGAMKRPGHILAVHTSIPRTEATLSAVLKEIGPGSVQTVQKDSLITNSSCIGLRNHLLENEGDARSYRDFDDAITNLCNDIAPETGPAHGQSDKIYDILDTGIREYEDVVDNMRRELSLNALSFAELAVELESALNSSADVVLFSAHDSTVSKLLNGLLVEANQLPPYASAVFMELRELKDGREYVAVTFQGEERAIGLFKEIKVLRTEFDKYLGAFTAASSRLLGLCSAFERESKGSGRRGKAAYNKKIEGLFEPEFVAAFKRAIGAKAPKAKRAAESAQLDEPGSGALALKRPTDSRLVSWQPAARESPLYGHSPQDKPGRLWLRFSGLFSSLFSGLLSKSPSGSRSLLAPSAAQPCAEKSCAEKQESQPCDEKRLATAIAAQSSCAGQKTCAKSQPSQSRAAEGCAAQEKPSDEQGCDSCCEEPASPMPVEVPENTKPAPKKKKKPAEETKSEEKSSFHSAFDEPGLKVTYAVLRPQCQKKCGSCAAGGCKQKQCSGKQADSADEPNKCESSQIKRTSSPSSCSQNNRENNDIVVQTGCGCEPPKDAGQCDQS